MSNERTIALGDKIRKIREKLGLTQQDVADKSGLHVSHYAKIERGELKAGLETLEKISKVLKLKIKDLF